MKSFRELRVWQAAMDLVQGIYVISRGFPKHETFALANQIQRAAVSVPSNIAEGHTREHLKEYLHHLSMAQASLAEVETQLEISKRLDYIHSVKFQDSNGEIVALGKQLYALRNSLRRNSTLTR